MTVVSHWQALLGMAITQMDRVSDTGVAIEGWSLGGGTALAIRIGHRISYDVDIFLPDPQVLGHFNPELADWPEDLLPDATGGDGSRFRKLIYKGLGEIDYIAVPSLSRHPYETWRVGGLIFNLETLAEIAAKKIVYRGANLRPRDVFDLCCIFRHDPDAGEVGYDTIPPGYLDSAIAKLRGFSNVFLTQSISDLAIVGEGVVDGAAIREEVLRHLVHLRHASRPPSQ